MKKKDFTDLKGKTIKELAKLASEKKLEAKKAKLEIAAGKQKNVKAFKNLRRDVVRILTLIKEKEIVEKLQANEAKGKEKAQE